MAVDVKSKNLARAAAPGFVLERSEAVPALIGALRDQEALIRGHAAWALGEIGNREAALDRRGHLAGIAEGIRARLNKDLTAVVLQSRSLPEARRELLQSRRELLDAAAAELDAKRKDFPDEPLWDKLAAEIRDRQVFLQGEAEAVDRIAAYLDAGQPAMRCGHEGSRLLMAGYDKLD